MIAPAKKLIFVHVQKTGGNAVCSALGVNADCPEKHFTAPSLRDIYGRELWQAYFKFAFVRNPWDRLVSWWTMIDGHRERYASGLALNKFQSFVLERATSFEAFLNECDEEIVDADGPKWIYRNQIDHLCDASGRIIVDFVGRFETLQSDFDMVMRRVAAEPIKLQVVNASVHRHYADYYSPALVEKVRDRFARDIAAFGYEFAVPSTDGVSLPSKRHFARAG